MSIIGLDPQANGWRDDGTESGAIRTDPTHGDMVPVPFVNGQFAMQRVGSTGSFQGGTYYNPDGSGSALYISVPAGQNGTRIWQSFRGSAFGIRYRATPTSPVVTVSVDGVPVAVDTSDNLNHITELGGLVDFFNGHAVTHRDLGPGAHVAEITVVAPPTGANSVTLYGYLADRAAGYTMPPSCHHLIVGGSVPTSFAYFIYGSSGQELIAIRRAIYHNPTAAEITVTVRYVTGEVIDIIKVPPSESRTFDLGAPVTSARVMQHQATAAGLIHHIVGVI